MKLSVHHQDWTVIKNVTVQTGVTFNCMNRIVFKWSWSYEQMIKKGITTVLSNPTVLKQQHSRGLYANK